MLGVILGVVALALVGAGLYPMMNEHRMEFAAVVLGAVVFILGGTILVGEVVYWWM